MLRIYSIIALSLVTFALGRISESPQHQAVLQEALWSMKPDGLMGSKACDPPLSKEQQKSGLGCIEEEETDTWECPKNAIAAFPLQDNAFFNWADYHAKGGKVWCLIPSD